MSVDNENVTFVKHDHIPFIRALKASEGRDIWMIGGGQVNTMLLNENLVDELQVFVMPVIIPGRDRTVRVSPAGKISDPGQKQELFLRGG